MQLNPTPPLPTAEEQILGERIDTNVGRCQQIWLQSPQAVAHICQQANEKFRRHGNFNGFVARINGMPRDQRKRWRVFLPGFFAAIADGCARYEGVGLEDVRFMFDQFAKTTDIAMRELPDLAGELKARMRSIKQDRNALFAAHQRLAVDRTNKYADKHGIPPDLRADFYQTAMLGLMRALDDYDYRLGFRFSTKATRWIDEAIQKNNPAKAPVYPSSSSTKSQISKISQAHDEFLRHKGREPTARNLAEITGLSVNLIHERLVNMFHIQGSDNPSREIDSIEEKGALPDEISEHRRLIEAVQQCLEGLGDQERLIIERRYGLNGQERVPLRVVAKEMNISQEWVRKRTEKIIMHMRKALV